jgi:hypothetical protein
LKEDDDDDDDEYYYDDDNHKNNNYLYITFIQLSYQPYNQQTSVDDNG